MIAKLFVNRLLACIVRDVHEVPRLVQVRLDGQIIAVPELDVIRPGGGVDEVAAAFVFLEDRIDLLLRFGAELVKSNGGDRLVAATVPGLARRQEAEAASDEECSSNVWACFHGG